MKIYLRKMTVFCFAAVFIIFAGLAACVDKDAPKKEVSKKETAAKGISDEELGIRKQSLFEEKNLVPAKGDYAESSPGASKKIERAFENSPPLIPHDLTGQLPITVDNNACVGCHMPDVAEGTGAVAIPRSHFMELATGKDHGGELRGERYACMLCHVPQAGLPVAVDNTFKGGFRDERSKYNSNLADTLNEGVK